MCAILQLVLQIRGGDRDNMGIIVLVLHKNIHFSKYLKEQIIFYHRHYNNIYSDQWPINLTTSGQEFPILLQHFEERSKCETTYFQCNLCPTCFDAIFEFSEIEAFFWKSIKSHKHGFKVIITKGHLIGHSVSMTRMVVLTLIEGFKDFKHSEKNFFF